MLGSAADALFRLYDVRWDETIANLEVDEGDNGTLDLSTVSDDAASFEFAPSHTTRTWLTISGTTLTVTDAPDVSVDTDYSADVRAVRDGINVDKTLTVRVLAVTPIITVPSAPTSLALTKTHNSISATFAAPTDLGGGVLRQI